MSVGLRFGLGSLGLLAIGAFSSGSLPSIKSLKSLFPITSISSSKKELSEYSVKKEEQTPEKVVKQKTEQVSESTIPATPLVEESVYLASPTTTATEETINSAIPKTTVKPTEKQVLGGDGSQESQKRASQGNGDGGFCANLHGIWHVKTSDQCSLETRTHYW